MNSLDSKHILIIVENASVPFDRRVWQEATALKDAGAEVSVICPQMQGYVTPYEVLKGIEIHRHPFPHEARGAIGYLFEYGTALYWEARLAREIYKKKPFHIIQGCNPPDLIYLVARKYKSKGVQYVFDHHDINPELYIVKFGKKNVFYHILRYLEKQTFKHASYSIATNESYKKIALGRGNMPRENVRVVRNGPMLDRVKIQDPILEYKKGRKYLVGYLGVIAEGEGIDLLFESARHICDKRDDVQFAIVGGGPELESLKELAKKMGLEAYVDFYGRVSDQLLVDILNTADVCVNPDTPSDMNNLSTMNKIMEYMALKKPIVQYDLKEGRISAGEASLYADNGSPEDFAEKMMFLFDNDTKRGEMGEFGRNRIVNELSWDLQANRLVDFYSEILGSC